MRISYAGISLIQEREGLRLKAYRDTGGVWTIGWGHTKGVKPGMTITEAQAMDFLLEDLRWAEEAVTKTVKVPLTQNRYDALVSLTYNIGATAFRKSTLVRKLNEGDYNAVPVEMLRWVYDNGKKIRGLELRRKAEAKLWRSGSPAENPFYPTGSDTVTGAGVSGTAGGALVVTEVVDAAREAQWSFSTGDVIGMALGAIVLFGSLYAIYARWNDAGRPNPFKRVNTDEYTFNS